MRGKFDGTFASVRSSITHFVECLDPPEFRLILTVCHISLHPSRFFLSTKMPFTHYFVHKGRKDKPRVLVEFRDPHHLPEQDTASLASGHPRRDSEYSPRSPQALFRENLSRQKSARERTASEESFDDDHYMRINIRWLDYVNNSENIRPGRIKEGRNYPRPRRPHNVLERNRLRLKSLADEELNVHLSRSRSSPTPITITARVFFSDVQIPVRAASVKRRKKSDNLRATAPAHETITSDSSAEMAADELQHLAEGAWLNF